MKRELILIMVLLSAMSALCQKPTVCYDLTGERISEPALQALEEEARRSGPKLIIGVRETEDGIEKRLFHRVQEGALPPEVFSRIKAGLREIEGRELPAEAIIVLNYYPGKDPCNASGTATRQDLSISYKNYQKRLKKEGDVRQYNIYRDDEGLKRYSLGRKWHKDKDGLVEQTFFAYHYPCGSYVVIDPAGNYRSYFGEAHADQILADVREMKEKL